MQGRVNPIRDMEPQQRAAGLPLAVRYVARVFGARKVVPDDVLRESCLIIKEQFGKLALVEIVQAYRMWAAQKFTALEMYGGEFNATQIARVLAGYCEYRQRINTELAQVQYDDAEAKAAAELKAKQLAEHAARIARFPQDVADAIANDRFLSPDAIPVTWYDFAEHHDMITLQPGEKHAFALTAERQIKAEQAGRLEQAKGVFATRSLRQHYEFVGNAPIWNRAKQLILWSKVLGRAPYRADK